MSHSKAEASKKLSTTEKIVKMGPEFFTLKNIIIESEIAAPMRDCQKLLNHVVKGEQTEALAMLEENPKLLLMGGKCEDYSGRTIIGTAFQIALGAGDQPMWEMMLPFFESLAPGEALRQFQEQFPNGIEDEVPSIDYNAIAAAIIQGKEQGAAAIETFRQKITSKKEVTHGKHFNLQDLIAAYQAYVENFKALGGALNNWENRDLFWKQVIGYVQRQMTTYDAQVHCSGCQSVFENKNFRRTLSLKDRVFFPLKDSSDLGFFFAVYSLALPGWSTGLRTPGCVAVRVLENYVEQKQTRLLDLESHLSNGCFISPIN